VLALVLFSSVPWRSAWAEPMPNALYECHTIVTGTDLRDRPAGFARCFLEVLVKLSGDAALASDTRAVAAAERADAVVAGFSYRDRMSGLAHHDDQGSSDRPQDLAVRFDPARVDAVLARLGTRPWAGPRPSLRVAVALQPGALHLGPGDQDDLVARARAALAAAAERYDVALATPTSDAVRWDGLPAQTEMAGGETAHVRGAIGWGEADGGWVGIWTMTRQGKEHRWDIRGASLDEAFRDMLLGVMALESGHPDAIPAGAETAARASGRAREPTSARR
jgi:uncharacterized protein